MLLLGKTGCGAYGNSHTLLSFYVSIKLLKTKVDFLKNDRHWEHESFVGHEYIFINSSYCSGKQLDPFKSGV